MKFILPRGMRDLEPEEYVMVEKVRTAFAETARLFGFSTMEPSPLELIETLEAKSGSAIRDEIYCFADKSGREVGLRFDLTVGLTRYVVSKRELRLPVKIGAFAGMWRYDEPQYGRYRWFYQWDAEIFGPRDLEADAEVIEFTSVFFDRMGLSGVLVKVGDRMLVEEFIRRDLGVQDTKVMLEMLRALDKLGKKSIEEVLTEYEEKGVKRETLERLIEFGRLRGQPDYVLSELSKMNFQRIKSLGDLVDSLYAREVKNVILDLSVVRGLDYYTGFVFEAYDQADLRIGALAGGGRYDSLPEAFGKSGMGATGVAGGVERTMLALSKKTAASKPARQNTFVACAVPELARAAFQIATRLRGSSIPAETELSGRNLSRQLDYASSQSIPVAVIVAPKEYQRDEVVVRDMNTGTERRVKMSDLSQALEAAGIKKA